MLKLAHIFQDGMVLQQNKPIRIWGCSDRFQEILVYLNDIEIANMTISSGEIEFILPPQRATFSGTLTFVAEDEQLTFCNVDIGEIWIAGGQSNMEFQLLYDAEGPLQIEHANQKHLRFYDVAKYSFCEEQAEGFKDSRGWNQWFTFDTENAGKFSAVGYYFAKKLQEKYHVPVAIVGCNWGGTSAATWLDTQYLEAKPELRIYLEEYNSAIQSLNLTKYKENTFEARKFMASTEMVEFQKKISSGHVSPLSLLKAIKYLNKFSGTLNQMGPQNINRPAGLYTHMLKNILGYSCRGVLWYQGENDVNKAELYGSLFSSLIACWREAWNEELPFLFVQLAPFKKRLTVSGERFPIIREKQDWVSRHVPLAYMVSIMDIGEKKDIHPKKKRPVGERLAMMALAKVYNEDVLCEAPEFLRGEVNEGVLRLAFRHVGDGLVLRGDKLNALRLFVDEIEIKKYQYTLSGDLIELRSKAIKSILNVCVQFASVPFCEVNIYNSAGLAAKPFIWDNKVSNKLGTL